MQPRAGRHDTPLERRYLTFLAEVGAIFGESLPYESMLQRVCETAVQTIADTATMYLYGENAELQVVAAAHVQSDRSERLRRRAIALLNDPKGPRRWFEAIVNRGRGLLVPSVDEASLAEAGGNLEYVTFIRETGVRSFVIVPLVTRGFVLGALALVYTDYSGSHFDEDSLLLAEDLGTRCGAAIEKARAHDMAVEVSERFQLVALPKHLPQVEGLELDSLYEPATSEMLVGGDWFDAFVLPGERLGLSVGDVSGHGIEAAALMGTLRSVLRMAMYLERDMVKVLAAADEFVRTEAPEGVYATSNIGVVDLRKRTLSCLAAGHPGPICWNPRTRKATDSFQDRGLPLGLRDMTAPQERAESIALEKNFFACYFTDGLLEAEGDYLRGEARLIDTIALPQIRRDAHPARAIRLAVAPERHFDDLAVLTLRVL